MKHKNGFFSNKNYHDSEEAGQLYEHLKGNHEGSGGSSPSEEAILAKDLQKVANSISPDAHFVVELEKALVNESSKLSERKTIGDNRKMFFRSADTWQSFAWGVVILTLVLGLAWAIRSLLPFTTAAGPTATQTLISSSMTMTPTVTPDDISAPLDILTSEADSIEQPATTPTPAPIFKLPILQDVEIILAAPIPDTPQGAIVYSQLTDEPLTPESALAIAQRLGVDGVVYEGASEGPTTVYIVSDGHIWMYFNGSPYRFSYFNPSTTGESVRQPPTNPIPGDEQIAIAEAFLEQAGLLDFLYQVELNPNYPFEVIFTPLIDGIPVSYGYFRNPTINVKVDTQGQVTEILYDKIAGQAIGDYPIISAAEAWQKMLSDPVTYGFSGIETYEQSAIPPVTIEWWNRVFQAGNRPNLFGTISTYQPVDPLKPILLSLGNYTLLFPSDDLANALASAVTPGTFFQVWGEIIDPSKILVEGWQISPFSDEQISGIVEREGEIAYLNTGEDRLLLPDLPADVPEGKEVRVRGVRLEQTEPSFEWSYLETGVLQMGGGGGGGGGNAFAEIDLTGDDNNVNTPEITPQSALQAGTTLDGIEGTSWIMIERYSDGHELKVIRFYPTNPDNLGGAYDMLLQGKGLEGIERSHTMPVRIWGSVLSNENGVITVDVSRFEPVYPEIAIQAWLGTWEVVNLDGKNVILFTTQDNQQFVLSSSLKFEQSEFVERPGDLVILEGVLYPGQTYAGIPLVDERAGQGAGDLTSLEGYDITSDDVSVIEIENKIGGRAIIDGIELVYRANNLQFGSLDPNALPMYIQPVWRFYGHYEDGRELDIQVQALREEFLK